MSTITLLVLFAAAGCVLGQYDSLERRAEKSVPLRLRNIRDSLVDPAMYQEIIFHVLSYMLPTDSENPICNNHSIHLQTAFLQDQLWALKMLDASSKVGAGVLHGNIQGLGSYDECLSVIEPQHHFTGKLCVVQTRDVLPAVVSNAATTQFSLLQPLPVDLALSVCVPSSCSAEDVAAHWRSVAAEFNASADVSPRDCSVRDEIQPETRTWISLTVLGFLLTAVIASTCYDYAINHQPTKEQRILLCFSVYHNLGKLFHSQRRVDSLDILDGIRVLAISWIVLGHRFEISLQVPNLILLNTERYTAAWFMSPALNMMLAVELFFLLSGCLLTYHFLQARLQGNKLNLLHFYYKRYTRLTPALAAVMMFEGCIMFYTSEGPLWKRLIGNRMDSCVQFWWTNLLYISNYVNPYHTCVLQSWYLSADMQLYILSPLLLIPLSRSHRGLLLLAACYFATTAGAFFNAYYLQLPAGSTVTLNKKTELNHGYEYVKTHVRAASWLTGVALGYLLHLQRHSAQPWKPSKTMSSVGWVICLTLCIGSVYSITPFQGLDHQYSPLGDSLHIALHRNIFSLGAAGIILLCVCRRGGFVRDLLGWSGFRPLAVLSYGVYLCHMGMQMVGMARLRQPYAFDMFSLLTGVMSDLLLANVLAVLLYVTVEAPCWELGRWLYSPTTAPAKANSKELKQTVIDKPYPEIVNLEDAKSVL